MLVQKGARSFAETRQGEAQVKSRQRKDRTRVEKMKR